MKIRMVKEKEAEIIYKMNLILKKIINIWETNNLIKKNMIDIKIYIFIFINVNEMK